MVGPPCSAHQLNAPDPCVGLTSGGSERKSVTETDLITAGGSSENSELPQTQTVTSTTPDDSGTDATNGTADTAPAADVASSERPAALSTMVLPELRALAKEIGVEGASGMRKSDLVAAIKERRGQSNGRARDTASEPTTQAADTAPDQAPAVSAEQQRRERRGASRGTGAPEGAEQTKDQPKD